MSNVDVLNQECGECKKSTQDFAAENMIRKFQGLPLNEIAFRRYFSGRGTSFLLLVCDMCATKNSRNSVSFSGYGYGDIKFHNVS